MSKDISIPPAFQHPGWYGVKPLPQHGLVGAKSHDPNTWTVKLRFQMRSNDGPDKGNFANKTGNGFFINIPDIDRAYIILTAGHNLIDGKGALCRDLKVEYRPDHMDKNAVPIPENDIYIPDEYRKTPKETNSINDWGAIRLRLPKKLEDHGRGFGFGFSLQLSTSKILREHLSLHGYLEGDCIPSELTGSCKIEETESLSYGIKTTPGLSGSPVHMSYRGERTVVAIHTYGSREERKSSQGTRLSEGLLRKLFGWAGVLHQNVALKALGQSGSRDPDPELYLRFVPGRASARIHKGLDGWVSRFDVCPSYSPPSSAKSPSLYAFKETEDKKWVLWDSAQWRVTLNDKLEDSYTPELKYEKENSQGPRAFRIVLTEGRHKMKELQMDPGQIREEDLAIKEFDFPGISFPMFFKNKYRTYHRFCLVE